MEEQMGQVSVRERLKRQKEARSGHVDTVLPVSQLAASYPAFLNHDAVLAALKQAGKNRSRVGAVLIAQHCLIAGERLAVADVTGLMHNDDVTHLTTLLLGDADAEDMQGN